LDLGKYFRGALTGDWRNAEREMQEYRALTTVTGSVTIPPVLSAQILDVARDNSLLLSSGVPLVPMESNNLTIARLKEDLAFGFKPEGEAIEETPAEFEGVELKAKTAYGLMSASLELVRSGANLKEFLLQAMGQALGRAIDRGLLFGSLAHEPAGILLSDKINDVQQVAALSDYAPFVQAVGKVRRANGEPTHMAINAEIDEVLNGLMTDQGLYLAPPPVLEKLTRILSNQLPADGGTGQNESTAMVFDPKAILVGIQENVRVEFAREASEAWQKGLVYFRTYAFVDIALLRPKWVTRITGLKAATT
jgi:HK97 family phage major capsid protein